MPNALQPGLFEQGAGTGSHSLSGTCSRSLAGTSSHSLELQRTSSISGLSGSTNVTAATVKHDISRDLLRQLSGISRASTAIDRLRIWTESSSAEAAIFGLVCIDIVLSLCGVFLNGFEHKRFEWTSVCHGFLLLVFSCDALARAFAELSPIKSTGKSQLIDALDIATSSRELTGNVTFSARFSCSFFVVWDCVLVFTGVLGACLWGLHSCASILPSMLRLSRVAKLQGSCRRVFFLRPLQLLLSTVGDSLYILGFGFGLLLLNMVFFSVLTMGVLKPAIDQQMRQDAIDRFGAQNVQNCHYAFSTLHTSMSTLFALSIGDQWHDIALPITFFIPWAFVLFLLHTFIASAVIVGLVYGALCQTMYRFQARPMSKIGLEAISQLHARKNVLKELAVIFESMDSDGSGFLTLQEFQATRKDNAEFFRIMELHDLYDSEVSLVWDIMDTTRDGKVSKEEFVDFMEKLLFDGGTWSRLKTMHCASQAHFRAEEVNKRVRNLEDELVANRFVMEKILEVAKMGRKAEEFEVEFEFPAAAAGTLFTQASVANDAADQKKRSDNSSELVQTSAAELMRAVDAEQVAHYGSDEVLAFWAGGTFIDKYSDKEYNMSHPTEKCDYFVSHCWTVPEGWYNYFQRNNRLETYEYVKAVEVHNVLSASGRLQSGNAFSSAGTPRGKSICGTTLWIDKCCIPQNDKKAKAACVAQIEEFMNLSNGLIVILSWQYFTRLWCVYEWACFLRTHNAALVQLGFDAFLKSNPHETLPLYLDSIENLSVRSSRCCYERDHAILEAKVFEYYKGETPEDSFAGFERFAKCSAICLMAKQLVLWRARGSLSDETAWLNPFRELADKLGYHQLGEVLRRAQPAKWFARSNRNQESFDKVVTYWFEQDCMPYLIQERLRAVRKFDRSADVLEHGVPSRGMASLFVREDEVSPRASSNHPTWTFSRSRELAESQSHPAEDFVNDLYRI